MHEACGLPMIFPDAKRFAFTILDDTDDSTLENVRPVYERLRDLGLRTTKTVWPQECPEGSRNYFAADTLQRSEYLEFVRELVDAGFELASHGATMETSERERTERGLAFLEREFGAVPRLHANHGENRENIHWGADRFQSRLLRGVARIASQHPPGTFAGIEPDSPYYWGDLFERHFDYLRNFTFASLDMLEVNPEMPYHLAQTPSVKGWFSTSDAPDVHAFRKLVTREGIDALEATGGVCIVSTHLGKGYTKDGRLDPVVDDLLEYVASKPGWFVPVSSLLDHLALTRGGTSAPLSGLALMRLELRFLFGRLAQRLGRG